MSKPSYLLGSAHLKDRRLINANDSIFIAIANTDFFGTELHPDSLYKFMFGIRYGERSLPRKLQLTEDQKEEFKRRYEKIHGVTPDSTHWTNPYLVRSIMAPKHDKDDDIESILDFYLYGVAKSLHKTVVGLEPEERLLSFTDNDLPVNLESSPDSVYYYAQFENLVQYYEEGNLQALWDHISPFIDWDEMEKRNRVMFENITKQMEKGSICAIVGASHLPSAIGLIDLLRADGYTLRPVGTKKTGLANMYMIDYKSMDWTSMNDTAYNFIVEFPEGYLHRKNNVFESSVSYGDLSTETELFVVANYVGNLGGLPEDEFLNEAIKKRMLDNAHEVVSQQTIERNGIQGIQVHTKRNGSFFRWEFWLKNNTLYRLLGYKNKGHIDDYLANRFFGSFKILSSDNRNTEEDFVHKIGAFSIKMPNTPQYMLNNLSENFEGKELVYKLHNYVALDTKRKTTYLVRYNDYPVGYFLQDRAGIINGLQEQLKERADFVERSESFYKDEAEGVGFIAQSKLSNVFIEFWIRGNRVYLIMQENLDVNDRDKDQEFFQSFRFLPYTQMDWKNFTIEDMQIDLPSKSLLQTHEDEIINNLTVSAFAALDSNSSTAYSIERITLSDYFRLDDNDSLYYDLYVNMKNIDEHLLSYQLITSDEVSAAVYTVQNTGFQNFSKKLFWTSGNNLYVLSAVADSAAIMDIDTDGLVKSIRFKETRPEFDLYSSKAELIAKDLSNADTAIFNQAKGAVQTYYTFKKEELPLVYQILRQSYSDDHEEDGIRATLIESLAKINDPRSATVLKEIINLPTSTDMLRAVILSNMLYVDSTQLDWYTVELDKYRPEVGDLAWQLLSPLRDSSIYMLNHLEKVTSLFDVKSYRPHLLNILLSMTDDSLSTITRESLRLYLPTVVRYIKDDVETYLTDSEKMDFSNQYFVSNYVKFLSIYNEKTEIEEVGTKLLHLDSLVLLHPIIVASYLHAGLPLEENVVQKVYDDLDKRSVLMNYLQKINRLDIVPSLYKEESEIGRMIVNEFVSSEWHTASQIDFLGEFEIDDQTYFIYAFKTNDDEQVYRAVYKPTPGVQQLEYNYDNVFSDFESNVTDWKEHALKIIRQEDTYQLQQ